MEKSPKKNKNKKLEPIKRTPERNKKDEINLSKSQKFNNFPKNVNEFRHIIDDVNCCRADIEFMLELRRYKRMQDLIKNIGSEPSFYQDDYLKYKKKMETKPEERKLLQINIGTYKHLLGDRTKYAINSPTFRYETRLRTEPNYLIKSAEKVRIKSDGNDKNTIPVKRDMPSWDTTTIPRGRNLFNTLLPPILTKSKEVFSKNESKVCRPINILKREGYINGEKIKSRIFNFNSMLALRYPSDHYPSSQYTNDYGIKNIGAIKHLLNSDNRTMTSYWSTYLRGLKNKVSSPEEIKEREKKLRDLSNEKSYPK